LATFEWIYLPGPADAPRDCTTFNATATALSIDCEATFDGGSLAWYALMVLHDKGYVVKHNQSVPTFLVTGLQPSKNHTFRVCASNSEYWMNQDCTQPFFGHTAREYGKKRIIRMFLYLLYAIFMALKA